MDINECADKFRNNCTQVCVNGEGNFSCACSSGYVLLEDGVTCVDEDECLDVQLCNGSCINTEGGYMCDCPKGYEERDRLCKGRTQSVIIFLFLIFSFHSLK